METLFVIGHLVVGIYFLNSGLNHFFHAKYLAGYAASKGVPFALFSVIAAGVMFALGGISMIIWLRPDIGLGLIVLALLPITTMMHNFWTVSDPMHRANEKIAFGKNIVLIGTILLLIAFILVG